MTMVSRSISTCFPGSERTTCQAAETTTGNTAASKAAENLIRMKALPPNVFSLIFQFTEKLRKSLADRSTPGARRATLALEKTWLP